MSYDYTRLRRLGLTDALALQTAPLVKVQQWQYIMTGLVSASIPTTNSDSTPISIYAQFAEALAYRSERPPTVVMGEGVEIPIPQNMLASLCGVSRTLFSEYVQQLA